MYVSALQNAAGFGRGHLISGPNALDHLHWPDSIPRTIVAFIGENENGILDRAARDVMTLLKPHGFTGEVVNLSDPAALDKLIGLLQRGIAFGWGAAGVGARLKLGQNALWDLAAVPFISVLADSPSWMPRNHHVPSRYVANGYVFTDWLRIQERFIRSPQLSGLIPQGTMPNPFCDNVRWSGRSRRMVFVKTGCDPAVHRAKWASMPKLTRLVIEDAAAAALQRGVGDITDALQEALESHGLFVEHRPDLFFAMMREVDVYVRDVRSSSMVKALRDLPVDIVGRGWDHIDTQDCRATFHGAIDAGRLPEVYADTQFLLNTMPNFSSGTHERVLGGFASKCCVVTDQNASMTDRFAHLPSYFGVDTQSASLPERLAALFHSTRRRDDDLQPAHDLVQRDFSNAAFLRAIMELSLEVRTASRFQDSMMTTSNPQVSNLDPAMISCLTDPALSSASRAAIDANEPS